jgi:endonuclease/exonuclease/phosphatase family metal-dependent hydrolase
MAKKSDDAGAQAARQLAAAFMKLPLKAKIAIGAVVLVGAVVLYFAARTPPPGPDPGAPVPTEFPPGSKTVVFCLWNMENLFDDRDDKLGPEDEKYDTWFVENPAERDAKYAKLADWLLTQNDGIGPDIIVGVEIESLRAAEMLRDALNARLRAGAPRYEHVAMEEVAAGRHIAPCVVSRYPLSGARLPERVRRILDVRVTVNNHELRVVAGHWTSQLTDREGTSRAKYATVMYDIYAEAIRANPRVDLLVCGDFNDSPDANSVTNVLHLTGDAKLVTPDANPPKLYGPLSNKPPEQFGTHYYNKPLVYDHVGFSPGMLDAAGWGYVAESVKVPTDGLTRGGTKVRRPWRYGSRDDKAVGRGYSDHFPVLVTLKVAP